MHFDLIIVGGGLAGLSLTCALRSAGISVALIERQPPPPAPELDQRIYALTPASRDFLVALGVWKHLDGARIAPVAAIEAFGDAAARLAFTAPAGADGALAYIVEAAQLAGELRESVKRQDGVQMFCPAAPARLSLTPAAAQLDLAGGERLRASLIVGADGANSWLRRAAGLTALATPYGECGVIANLACAKPHGNVARQWFLGADGILAWLPLPGERISIVWSAPAGLAAELLALPLPELAARVALAGDGALGRLELLAPPAALPLRLLRVPQIVDTRLALVGDAAHGIHPLSGHGINLGLQDARCLSELLLARAPGQETGDRALLQRYQRARREEIAVTQGGTDLLHKLFASRLPGVGALRNHGMNLLDRLPGAKRLLADYAMGRW